MRAITRLPVLAAVAVLATALAINFTPAYAQKHGSGGSGGMGGSGGGGCSDCGGSGGSGVDEGYHAGGKGPQGGGPGVSHGSSRSQSLRDVFHGMETGTDQGSSATSEQYGGSKKGGSSATTSGHRKTTVTTSGHKSSGTASKKGGHTKPTAATSTRGHKSSSTASKKGGHTKPTAATTTRGQKGSSTASKKGGHTTPSAEEESDRKPWAGTPGREGKPGRGNTASGTKKGDIYGDMYVILRDPITGEPILSEAGFVQYLAADGKTILPVDAEGNLINPELAVPVDLGRLSVGRSSTSVLASQYEEVLKEINAADSVSVDASGRLVLTTNGVSAAIDSPLANLALYVEVLNTGGITGVTDPSKFTGNLADLVTAGSPTTTDMSFAASFLAAAADKTGTLTIDSIVNMNTILGVDGTLPNNLVDYSTFTYDRATTYKDLTIQVLVPDGTAADGSALYKVSTVPVYDAVFKSTDNTPAEGVTAFAQAADDALQVIEYVHNNAVPTTTASE